MNGRERTIRAVKMQNPDMVPVYYFNKDIEKSDIVSFPMGTARSFSPKVHGETEWGYVWETIDDTCGQPKEAVIKEWSDFANYIPPNPYSEGRFDGIEEFIEKNKDKFKLVYIGITGFSLMTFLRGFEDTLLDFYINEEEISAFADMVFGVEEEIMNQLCDYDIDAISFYDDWGTQNALMINPELWRSFFKERYKKQFDTIHKKGKFVYFHSCGNVIDIIDDLIEIGADILNFNQPGILGIDTLAERFGGRVCINAPVDIQNVAINGTKEEIFDFTNQLMTKLGCYNGGFIGHLEEYHSIGLSDENYNYCAEALEEMRKKG